MSKRFAIIAGIVLLGITALAVLVPVPHSDPVSMVGKTVESQTTVPAQTVAADTKVPGFYGDNVRAALFARPLPPQETPAPTETQPQPASDPPTVTPAPDTFASCVYSGIVTIDGQKHALVESSQSREGSYLVQGDTYMGATVMQIDDNAVTLSVHGKMRRIPKSTAYNVVPLDKAAPAPSNKNSQNTGNPNGSPVVALAYDEEQQLAAEALSRAFSEGTLQTTISATGDGGNAVIYSLDISNNP